MVNLCKRWINLALTCKDLSMKVTWHLLITKISVECLLTGQHSQEIPLPLKDNSFNNHLPKYQGATSPFSAWILGDNIMKIQAQLLSLNCQSSLELNNLYNKDSLLAPKSMTFKDTLWFLSLTREESMDRLGKPQISLLLDSDIP